MIHRQIIEIKSPRPFILTLVIKKFYELECTHKSLNSLITIILRKIKRWDYPS